MEIALGIILLVAFAGYATWRSRVDVLKNGKVTAAIRTRTYLFTAMWFVLLMALFYLFIPAYALLVAVFYVFSQVFGVGEGKHGLARQLRDSGFIACVVSVPISLIIWGVMHA